MSREIKFRFWNEKLTRWENLHEDIYIGEHGDCYFVELGKGWDRCDSLVRIELIPCELTGLKDKNGKEIYKGDIIKIFIAVSYPLGGTHREEQIAEIIFSGGAYWWKSKSHSDCLWHFYNAQDREIIGNIYENPELLK